VSPRRKAKWVVFALLATGIGVGIVETHVASQPRGALVPIGLRASAAFVLAKLGIGWGFEDLEAILNDKSTARYADRPSRGSMWSPQRGVAEDRYFAAHLLGELGDARAIPLLVPLLKDPDVRDAVPWSLSQIGGKSVVPPLIDELSDPDPDMRYLAILSLVDLRATEALPKIRQLTDDQQRTHIDRLISVGTAAREAVASLDTSP
jgi:HEAT repeat protein